MQGNQPDHQLSTKSSEIIFKPSPVSMFVASVVIIFIAEALVMLLIYFLKLPESHLIGLFDAVLLSLFVAPTLYFMLLKPMRETIHNLDKSEQIKKQLEEVAQLKSDFISIAAHELCTPVTAIMGYTDILIDDVDPEKRTEYLKVILRKTQTLERIIDDLDIVNRLETGENLQITLAEHDLVETVNRVCNVYRMRFPDVSFCFDLPGNPWFYCVMKFA